MFFCNSVILGLHLSERMRKILENELLDIEKLVDTAENGHPDRSAHASAPPLSKTALCLPMHLFTMQHGLDGAVLDAQAAVHIG